MVNRESLSGAFWLCTICFATGFIASSRISSNRMKIVGEQTLTVDKLASLVTDLRVKNFQLNRQLVLDQSRDRLQVVTNPNAKPTKPDGYFRQPIQLRNAKNPTHESPKTANADRNDATQGTRSAVRVVESVQ